MYQKIIQELNDEFNKCSEMGLTIKTHKFYKVEYLGLEEMKDIDIFNVIELLKRINCDGQVDFLYKCARVFLMKKFKEFIKEHV